MQSYIVDLQSLNPKKITAIADATAVKNNKKILL
jgi:hypothetical protein